MRKRLITAFLSSVLLGVGLFGFKFTSPVLAGNVRNYWYCNDHSYSANNGNTVETWRTCADLGKDGYFYGTLRITSELSSWPYATCIIDIYLVDGGKSTNHSDRYIKVLCPGVPGASFFYWANRISEYSGHTYHEDVYARHYYSSFNERENYYLSKYITY